jgi:hypothetical protein
MGILSLIAIYQVTTLYLHIPGAQIPGVWIRKGPPLDLFGYFRVLLLQGLSAAGAVMSIWRPARGFLMIGASSLAGALATAVHSFPAMESLKLISSLLVYGATYTWLGFRQLEADHSASE